MAITDYQGPTIQVAYNYETRRYEQVFPESELGGEQPITMHWLASIGRYVTVPADDEVSEWAAPILDEKKSEASKHRQNWEDDWKEGRTDRKPPWLS